MQGHDTRNGWPLGLGNTNARIREAAQPHPPNVHLHRSLSFSSFSSSDLETESTGSFYRDRSVSLGVLMGMWPGCKGQDEVNLTWAHPEMSHQLVIHSPQLPKGQTHNSEGICASLFYHIFELWRPTPSPNS